MLRMLCTLTLGIDAADAVHPQGIAPAYFRGSLAGCWRSEV
jgi:hypothetical protein